MEEIIANLRNTVKVIGDNFFPDSKGKKVGDKFVPYWDTTLLVLTYALGKNALIMGSEDEDKLSLPLAIASIMGGCPASWYQETYIKGELNTLEKLVTIPDHIIHPEEYCDSIRITPHYPAWIIPEIAALNESQTKRIKNLIEQNKITSFASVTYNEKGEFELYNSDRFEFQLSCEPKVKVNDSDIESIYHQDLTDRMIAISLDILNQENISNEKEKQGDLLVKIIGNESIERNRKRYGVFPYSNEDKEILKRNLKEYPIKKGFQNLEGITFLDFLSQEFGSVIRRDYFGENEEEYLRYIEIRRKEAWEKIKRKAEKGDDKRYTKLNLNKIKIRRAKIAETILGGPPAYDVLLSIKDYSKALALLMGDSEVTKDHITAIAPHVLGHRIRYREDFLEKEKAMPREMSLYLDVSRNLIDKISRDSASTKDYSIIDKLIEAGFPESVLEANREMWEMLTSADKNDVPSANPVFEITDQKGENWVLKLYDRSNPGNERKAKLMSIANYYLSQNLDFIVPGKSPKPIEVEKYYLTLQKKIPQEEKVKMPLEYWVSSIAQYHKEARKILEENGAELIKAPIRGHDFFNEQRKKAKKTIEVSFDKSKLQDCIDYLKDDTLQTIIHRDLKEDNLFGPFLIDLDNSCLGNPGIDLAMLFAQYQLPKERWDQYFQMYLDVQGFEGSLGSALKELRKATEFGTYYCTTNEALGSSNRKITKRTLPRNASMLSYRDLIFA